MELSTASASSAASNMTPTTNTSYVELYVVVVLLLVFCVLGVAGNVVVLAVFCQCGDQLTSTVFILVLAAVDFTTCLAVVPFTIYIELVHYHVGVDFVCKLYQVCCFRVCVSAYWTESCNYSGARCQWEMPFLRSCSSETLRPTFQKWHDLLCCRPKPERKFQDQSVQRGRGCTCVHLTPSGVYFYF